mmetsp:Transcript_51484/g.145107  ORF Transcript_51484/g.145107 Transcript_51484/m.145107 type:complete len:88 (-) Transcript_51484:342-605(-)
MTTSPGSAAGSPARKEYAAPELAMRVQATRSATGNASDLQRTLELQRNRACQAWISQRQSNHYQRFSLSERHFAMSRRKDYHITESL